MDRPVMNPLFLDDQASETPRRGLWHWARLALRALPALLLLDLRFWKPNRLRLEDGSPLARLVHGVLYPLAFAPLLIVAALVLVMFIATHPTRTGGSTDPQLQGVFYDPVTFLSADGTSLEGWLVPVIDEKLVLAERDRILDRRQPAVVLVHDFGYSRQQLLPMVVPLHRAGFVVLAISLRGSGGSSLRGCTFGLKESADVKAAVDMLRRRNFIDGRRIAILGVGTGANAAILCAREDPQVAALVLDRPLNGFQDAQNTYIGVNSRWQRWVGSICRWSFEVGYGVDATDLEAASRRELLSSRPVLLLDRSPDRSVDCLGPVGMGQALAFLQTHLGTEVAESSRDVLVP